MRNTLSGAIKFLRVKNYVLELFAYYYHRKILFTDFSSKSHFQFFPAKDSAPKEKIPYICGLRARIKYAPLSEHLIHSDRDTDIGYLFFWDASISPAENQ